MRCDPEDPTTSASKLPRLLYLADLEVYPSYAGAIHLYRLLERYPREKLLLVFPGARTRQALPGARYLEPPTPVWLPLARRRGGRHLLSGMSLLHWLSYELMGGMPGWLRATCETFRPEAILTVGLGGSWALADCLSRRYQLPLHLIVQDDRAFSAVFATPVKEYAERKFAGVYRRAASRLVCSPAMEQTYRQRFHASGHVLYPARGGHHDTLRPSSPGIRRSRPCVAYAGSLWSEAAWQYLSRLGHLLGQRGFSLIGYVSNPHTRPAGLALGFELRPALPGHRLAGELQHEADFLLQYASFAPADIEATTTLFPSKLVDYSATGLPVLMIAPDYSSSAWLARAYPEAFTLVTHDDPVAAVSALAMLATDQTGARTKGVNLHNLGLKLFSQQAGYALLCQFLTGTNQP